MSDSIEIIPSLDELDGIVERWRELAVQSGNVFVTPEWYLAWFAAIGADASPVIGVHRDERGAIACIWPLVATGRRRARVLSFAGGAMGDRFHPLGSDSAGEAGRAILDRLRAGGDRPALRLDHVERDLGWVDELVRGQTVTELGHLAGVLPEIELAGTSWEEYLAARSRNLRSQLGRRRRKLGRDHDVHFRLTDSDRLDADMEAFFALHQHRWTSRGGPGALSDPARVRFHRDFSRRALERGWLRLWIVEVDERPAAAWYGWHVGDRYSYYLAGFDQRYSEYSIGLLLLAHTVRHAIEEGTALYELLLGREDFKLRFATRERRVRTVVVSAPRHPARRAAIAEERARRLLARLPDGARARIARSLKVLTRRSRE